MDIVLIVFGAACLIGAVVGGGVKVKQKDTEVQVPLVASMQRQLLLGGLGMAFLLSGAVINYQARHQFDGIINQQTQQLAQLQGLSPTPQPVAQPKSETPEQPADVLAGTWRANDGSLMVFTKTAAGYTVVSSKPGGFTDRGSASLESGQVSISLRNSMIGDYTGTFALDGNTMSGTMIAAGLQIPVLLTR